MQQEHIVFFDGVCNLCSSSVQTILKYDKKNYFLFAPLQGETAKEKLSVYLSAHPSIDSIILFSEGKISSKSTAVLNIAKQLSFPLNLSYVFIVIPAFLRNLAYNFIAKNRYHWFGKKEECWLPTPELKSRFLL